MLKAKKSASDSKKASGHETEQSKLSEEAYSNPYQKFLGIFNEDYKNSKTGWGVKFQMKETRNGLRIEVHQRKNKTHNCDLVRTDAEMEGVSVEDLINFITDPSKTMDMKMMKESYLVEQVSPTEKIIYIRFKVPLMSERDNVLRVQRYDNDDGSVFVQLSSTQRDDVPERPGVVRIFAQINVLARKCSENPKVVKYTEISYLDLKGYMPAMLQNMVIASEQSKEIENLYLKLPKY